MAVPNSFWRLVLLLLKDRVTNSQEAQAFRHLKKEMRWHEQVTDESVLKESPEQIAWSPSEMIEQLKSLKCLSPASRAVLTLHFQEELPLAEVAAILKIPLGTVKSRLAYGLNTIRKQVLKKGSNMIVRAVLFLIFYLQSMHEPRLARRKIRAIFL